jgi:formylglycine-generating enzyme required for sulfatase activity
VVSKLEAGRLPGGQTGLCFRMLANQGDHPFAALMELLRPYALQSGLKPEEIVKITNELEESPQSLSRHLRTIGERGTNGKAVVLFLDQLEEWFPKDEPTQRTPAQDFLSAVYQAAQEEVLWVLATIRSDQLHHCHNHPDMLELLREEGHYPLGTIEPFMLWDMIKKPARCAGLTITDQLVSTLIQEMMNNRGSLPLLAFVLQELYLNRSPKGELSEAVYQKLGGVSGAIAKHAATVEAKIQQQLGEKAGALWPTLFRSLVVVDADGLPSRRRPLRSELNPELAELLDVLIDERLLYSEGKESSTVSLSHEKLLEAWPSLQGYVTTNKKHLMDHTLLKVRAQKWKDLGKSWYRGLASGREDKDYQRAGVMLTPLTNDYLQVSRQFREVRKWLIVFLAFGSLCMVGYVSFDRWVQSQRHEGLETTEVAKFFLTRVGIGVGIDLLSPQLVTIKAGSTFTRGDDSGDGEEDGQPAHEVRFSKPFAIGKHEVTFREYDLFTWDTLREKEKLPDDSRWGRGQRPVIYVTWQEARDYATWLSEQTGQEYRLPTEAEWEYAARSGGKKEKWAGISKAAQLRDYAVYSDNSDHKTAKVGSKLPNGLRLYDMSGNVAEWVEDCWHKDYTDAPKDGAAWLESGGVDCNERVVRGGPWNAKPVFLRTSFRDRAIPDIRGDILGFRLAQDIP